MRSVWMVFGVALTLGCQSKGSVEIDVTVDEVNSAEQTLQLSLSSHDAIAGDAIEYTLAWVNGDGAEEAVEAYTLVSDVESPLATDGSAFIATVAGGHTLTATATDADGTDQSAEQSLSVEPGEIAVMSVELSADVVAAGEVVTYTISTEDSYGNAASTDDAEIAVDDSVTVDESDLTSTLAGDHTITATIGELQGEATWTVQAGPAAAIDLALAETTLELGDETEFTITVTDEYGNETDDATDVGVDEAGATVGEGTIQFDAEGLFSCWATVTDTDLMDVETVFIDSTGPVLNIVTPERGTWTTDTMTVVSGTVADAGSDLESLTINGAVVEPAADGTFEHDLALGFGVSIIETVAMDTDLDDEGVGNQSTDVRAVLQADTFWDPGAALYDGLIFRMWEGEGGLGELESMAATLMDSVDLDALLDGPIYDETFCFTILWWEVCYDLTIYVDSLTYESVSLAIDPTDEGVITARLSMEDILLELHTEGYVDGVGTVTASAINVDISFVPAVTEGGYMAVTEFSIDVPPAEELVVELDEELSDAAVLLGIDPTELIEEQLTDALSGVISDSVPDLLAETLGALAFDQEFDLSDNTYTLSSRIQSIDVDDAGITFIGRTEVDVAEVFSDTDGLPEGFPKFDYSMPTTGSMGSGTQFSLSSDMLNQLMFAFWQGGLLDQQITDEDLDIDMGLIGLILPGMDALNMITTPMLPPVVIPRADWSEGHEYDLYLGDMMVQIHDGEVTDDSLVLELFISAIAPMALGAEEDGWSIEMELSDPMVYADSVYINPEFTVTPSAVETLFVGLMAAYLPELTGALGTVPLPEIEGMSIIDISTGMDGGDEPPGYWVLSGSLE
jgi:hypothetical protein